MRKLLSTPRLVVLILTFAVFMSIYVIALYKLQIIEGAKYYAQSQNSITTEKVVPAARGNMLDRYGRVLVSNTACNNLSIDTTELFERDDPNAVILELCQAVHMFHDEYNDTLPITMSPPFEYIPDMTALQRSMLNAWLDAKDLPRDATAAEVMATARARYNIAGSYSAEEARIITGVRYEINVRYDINTTPYIFAEDVSMPLLTYLMEQPGAVWREAGFGSTAIRRDPITGCTGNGSWRRKSGTACGYTLPWRTIRDLRNRSGSGISGSIPGCFTGDSYWDSGCRRKGGYTISSRRRWWETLRRTATNGTFPVTTGR